MQLHPKPLNCNGMTCHGNDLLVEASTVGFERFERLYDDACDEGVVMRSPRTGNDTRWYHTDTVRDADQDVVEWVFKPCSESVAKIPSIAFLTLRIIND
jgi:hypothetical protein